MRPMRGFPWSGGGVSSPNPYYDGRRRSKRSRVLVIESQNEGAGAERNRLIALIATAFISGDYAELRKRGAPARWLPRVAIKNVVVLVDSDQQARELLKELPSWKICTRFPGRFKRSGQPPTRTEGLGRRIATFGYVKKYGITTRVLIRATAAHRYFPVKYIRDTADREYLPPWIVDLHIELDRSGEYRWFGCRIQPWIAEFQGGPDRSSE